MAIRCVTYLLGLDECGDDTDGGNEGNAERVVVVVVQRPQNNTRDLEHIERVYDLKRLRIVRVRSRMSRQRICAPHQ